jgi:hypothetical protein
MCVLVVRAWSALSASPRPAPLAPAPAAGGDRADQLALVVSGAFITISFYMLMPYVFMSLFTSDKRFFLAGAGVAQGWR